MWCRPILLSANGWVTVGWEVRPQPGREAQMLPDFASEKTKQGPLDKLFLLTLARRVLPHYLSALVGNGLPLLLLCLLVPFPLLCKLCFPQACPGLVFSPPHGSPAPLERCVTGVWADKICQDSVFQLGSARSVSYTHLTLPTNTVTCRSRWSPYH